MFSEMTWMLVLMGFIWVMIVAAMALLPYYTRKSIAFGIAVPPEQNKEEFLTGLRKHYAGLTAIMGVILAAVSLFALVRMDEQAAITLYVGTIVLYAVLAFVVYARCNIFVRNFKRDSDWVIQSQSAAMLVSRDDTRKLFNPLWYLTHLALIAGTAAYSLYLYPSLPPRLALNTDLQGNVTNYADTSYWVIMQMPLVMLVMLALFAGIGVMINRAKRQTDDPSKSQGFYNNRSFQIVMGHCMFWLGLFIQILVAAGQMQVLEVISLQVILWLTGILFAVITIGLIYIAVKVGQGGYRLSSDTGDDVLTAGDDRYWILYGSFYNNPNDSAIFIERRVGIGWTINLGRPAGKAIIILTFVVIIAMVVAVPLMTNSAG